MAVFPGCWRYVVLPPAFGAFHPARRSCTSCPGHGRNKPSKLTKTGASMLFPTTIAGSLPKPEWLAEPNTLWAPWKSQGAELARAKRDATVLAVKLQEDAGVDIVTEGEQSRQHFVHGFLVNIEGIDFAHKVEMGIRNDRYKAMVPQVVAPLRLKARVH